MNPLIVRYRDALTAGGLFAIGLAMRLWNLGSPKGFIFDELYYAKNAHSLLLHGVELDNGKAEFIVHPPVGKWLIAGGIKLFGFHEFGWRFSSALVGSLSIVLIYFVAKALFDNYLYSSLAGGLTLLDGLHLVHSRTALLDIFLMFFLLLAFYFLLHSRHWMAGIALGLALATKWTGIYYLVAFFLFMIYADYRQERAMENQTPVKTVLQEKFLPRVSQFGFVPILVYILSWAGWFLTKTGWDRDHSSNPLISLWYYHTQMWQFHTNLTDKHSYQANPWAWLILGRPTSFYYATPNTCGAQSCSREILALGTPFLWWSGVLAIAATIGYWIVRREWQSGLLLLALSAGYLPWFLIQKRTMFSFYAIAIEPFLILIIVYTISKFLEIDCKKRRIVVAMWFASIALCFIYFWPIYVGTTTSYAAWFSRMWLPSWI